MQREASELNFEAKRIERATRAEGARFEAWRAGAEPPRKLPPETAGRAGKDGAKPVQNARGQGGCAVGVRARRALAPTRPRRGVHDGSVRRHRERSGDAGRGVAVRAADAARTGGGGLGPEDGDFCLGDGAEWIRRMFDDWFPDARRSWTTTTSPSTWTAARARHGDSDLAAA